MTCIFEGCDRPRTSGELCSGHASQRTRKGRLSPLAYRLNDSLENRLWSKVDKTETCWIWLGPTAGKGYGILSNGRSKPRIYVHRLSYELARGPIPAGLMIDHKCHQIRCVRPDHLQAVTASENLQNRQGAMPRSKSGVRGVHYDSTRRKWVTACRVGGKVVFMKRYATLEEASAAVAEARRQFMTNSLRDLERPPMSGDWEIPEYERTEWAEKSGDDSPVPPF